MMKYFIILRMDRKNLGEICKIISQSRLVLRSVLQQVDINLHTKYDFLACTVVEISLTENFIILRIKRKKVEHIEE